MDKHRYVPLTIGKDGVVLAVGHCTSQATANRRASMGLPVVCVILGFLMGLWCGWLIWY